jgi:DNA-binding transcriptional MerR regulator
MAENAEKFTLDELCSLVDVPKRTVRFYIQNDLVDRPEGSKRGSYYVRRHMDQLLEIQKWQNAGLSLERIRELLAGRKGEGPLPPIRRRKPGDVEVWSHIMIRDGVELMIEPQQAELTPEQIRKLARGIIKLFQDITGNG